MGLQEPGGLPFFMKWYDVLGFLGHGPWVVARLARNLGV